MGHKGELFHICALWFSDQSELLRAAIYNKYARSETEFLAMKMCCLLFLCTEGERKRLEVSSLDYRES